MTKSPRTRRRPTYGSRALALAIEGQKQTDVARKLGVSDAALGRWLTGERIPVAKYLLLIETTYDVKATLWGQPLAGPANDSDATAKAG